MEIDTISIKLTSLPYNQRQRRIFKWTLALYLIILIVAGLNTDLNGFLITVTFLSPLFIADYSRRLRWVRFSLDSLDANYSGVKLTYRDKDNLLSAIIPWNKLTVTKGVTFTKNPTKSISFKYDIDVIASFYATDNFDNEKIDDLYDRIEKMKLANA